MSQKWSMGCILYELAAGQKAFWSDLAVLDYRRVGEEFALVLDETYDEMSKSHIEKLNRH